MYGFATLSLVLREVHDWRIHKQKVLRRIFAFKRGELGYINSIIGMFVICNLHKMEACKCDQIKMNEMAVHVERKE